MGGSQRVGDTRLHSAFTRAEAVGWTILAERLLGPDSRVPVPWIAKTVLEAPGDPERRRERGARPVRVVEAELAHLAQPAVPAAQGVETAVLLVVPAFADALADVPGVLPADRIVGAVAVAGVVRAGEGVLAVWAYYGRVHCPARTKVVLLAKLPEKGAGRGI